VVDVGVDEGTQVEGIDEDRRYARSLGERLRGVRQQQNLSLHDVEARSRGELKASVVGAYERGERAVSITRLQVLAGFYRVPVAELLPEPIGIGVTDEPALDVDTGDVVIDLVALEEHREDEPVLARYVESIQARRGDYNGRVLTVRASDLATLAAVLDREPDELHQRLSSVGIVR
jgi:transcriptional regulator with XRE-family HTH domain